MVDEELAVVEADITAYEAALARLEASPAVPLPQEQFEAELRQAEEEERSERWASCLIFVCREDGRFG